MRVELQHNTFHLIPVMNSIVEKKKALKCNAAAFDVMFGHEPYMEMQLTVNIPYFV